MCLLPAAFLHCVVEVVREVEVGELMCDSLKDAPDSTLLRFAISSTEVRVKVKVLAEPSCIPSSFNGVPAWRGIGTQQTRHFGGESKSLLDGECANFYERSLITSP